MNGMFHSAYEFNRDLSRWDVSKVTNMDGMFYRAFEFNQDISMWDVSQVRAMSSMFSEASSFNQDLCKWANKFPYYWAGGIFYHTKCEYQSDPVRENGGPFCASDCKS
jgi:surface protein